jgi:hypothetical protein
MIAIRKNPVRNGNVSELTAPSRLRLLHLVYGLWVHLRM